MICMDIYWHQFSDEEAVRLIEMEPPQKRKSNAPVKDSIPRTTHGY